MSGTPDQEPEPIAPVTAEYIALYGAREGLILVTLVCQRCENEVPNVPISKVTRKSGDPISLLCGSCMQSYMMVK